MKYLLLCGVILVVLFEVALCERATEDEIDTLLEELTDRLLKRKLARLEQREHESHKREMLESAAKLTQAQLRQENRRKVSSPAMKIAKFKESNPTIRRRGLAARTQLNVIHAYRKEWLKKRGNAENGDFWKDLNEEFDGHILHKRVSQVSTVTSVDNPILTTCPFTEPTCDANAPYRTINGTCNNLDHGLWGSANRAQIRLLKASYSDDIEQVRLAKDGSALSSAREVANRILSVRDDGNANNNRFTYMVMQFGQFLDHDITSTPEASTENAEGKAEEIDCGAGSVFVTCTPANKECMPIEIPNGDPTMTAGDCMKFVRSQVYMDDSCKPEPKAVPNAITTWLDLSSVYGSDDTTARELMDPATGKMKTKTQAGVNNVLPTMSNAESHCSADEEDYLCFKAGDSRINEQIGLTSMHTVFVRYHNNIVQKLSAEEPTLQGRELYQMARKILIGLWQHMVYSEYLPVILGRNVMTNYGLNPRTNNFFTGYDKNQRPDIITSFSTAAFRMGHSEIRSFMKLVNLLYNNEKEMALSEIQMNPTMLYTGPSAQVPGIDSVLMGLVNSSIAQWDRFFSGQVRNHLFADNKDAMGFDLIARNIQRGRDHGLASYLDYREFCKLDPVRPTTFNDLINLNEPPNARGPNIKTLFSQAYRHVDDIDLFAGAMAEQNIPGANVGETFGCIIGLQFKAFKNGDRFYYENDNSLTGFTTDQLAEIRSFTLAKLLCHTLESRQSISIQPFVFRPAGATIQGTVNNRQACSGMVDIDYKKFRSTPANPQPGTQGGQQPSGGPPPPSGGPPPPSGGPPPGQPPQGGNRPAGGNRGGGRGGGGGRR